MSVEDLLAGWGELEAEFEDYVEAEAYAKGKVDEVFAVDSQVAQRLAAASRRYKFSLLGVPIGSRVDRLIVTAIKANGADGEPDENATKAIEMIYDANDLDVHYQDLMEKVCTYGDAYVQVWPLAEEESDDDILTSGQADDELLAAGVEFTIHDPLNTRVVYDPTNERRKAFAIRRWQIDAGEAAEDGVKVWRVDVWYPETIEHWVSAPNATLTEPDAWAPYAEDADDGQELVAPEEENPYGEVPFFHHRTGLPYGRPVHEAGYGAQNAIYKMLCTQLDTSEDQGWPQRYRLLDPDAELDTNQGGPEWVDDTQAAAYSPGGLTGRGGSSTGVKQGPGTLQTWTGTKEVGQFEAADPELFWGPAINFIKLMATLTRTPASHFWPEETKLGGAPSGDSREKEEGPLIASVQWLQKLQQAPVREEWKFALRVTGTKVAGIGIQWAPIKVAETLEDWQVVGLKQQYGVPAEQTLTEAGYTQEQAAEWQAEAEKKQAEMMDQIGQLAEAEGRTAEEGQRKELTAKVKPGAKK